MSDFEIDFDILLLLLKASSKQKVIDVFEDAFKYREKDFPPNQVLKLVAEATGSEVTESTKLFVSICNLIRSTLFHCHSTSEGIETLFPSDFHKNLKDLICKIVSERYSSWKTSVTIDSVSMPRLTEFDWRVDLKMASGKVARMSEPSCILNLKILDPALPSNDENKFQTLNVELSKEKLDTMLNGLSRIRDQLSAVAKK